MSEKEDQADVGDLTENAEYDDDFENDPEGLTDEEEKQNENPEEKDVATDSIQKDDEEIEENLDQLSEADANVKVIYANEKYLESTAGQKDHKSARESSIQESKQANEQELHEGEDEELKHYVSGKKEANKDLENQDPANESTEQKLKFKDEMGLQAPPPEDAEVCQCTDLAGRDDVSLTLSQLRVSDDVGQEPTSISGRAGPDEAMADGNETQQTSAESSSLPTATQVKEMPPSDSKDHPDSAKDQGEQKAESASKSVKSSTYTLTPRQKELRKQIEIRKEMLKREEEERKRQLEELKRRENELVFRAWLRKKKLQIQEEKRNRRAKKLEELRIKEVNRDPEEAYRLWLKKKHQQYVKEKRLEFLRRQTEEVSFFPSAEECDRAFRDWLRRKREEKQAAELAAKERERQLRLEARRARKMRNFQYI